MNTIKNTLEAQQRKFQSHWTIRLLHWAMPYTIKRFSRIRKAQRLIAIYEHDEKKKARKDSLAWFLYEGTVRFYNIEKFWWMPHKNTIQPFPT